MISSGAGGVLVMNVNDRSSKIVISTGMMLPRWASVAALYCLHEVHDVDAVRAQRGTDRRGRGGRARGQLHLDDGMIFFFLAAWSFSRC